MEPDTMRRTLSLFAILALFSAIAFAAAVDTTVPDKPTFNRDVLPIMQENCQGCHRPEGLDLGGMVAPMSLLTYREVRPWVKSIARLVTSREMPPWSAAEWQHGLFEGERVLTETEIQTIARWASTGAALGDAADAPAPIDFGTNDGWAIGKPDLILTMPVEYVVEDDVEDEYATFRTSLTAEQLPEDRWIKALQFKPTGSFVHHIILRPIGGIAPGYAPRINAQGHGALLKKGAEVSWQMHYHKEPGEGSAMVDNNTRVGIVFYKPGEVITHRIKGASLATRGFRIPAGDPNYSHSGEYVFEEDAFVTAFNPHMHLRGKAAKVVATFPDGEERVLLDVPRYDFNWQHTYRYKEPVFVPAGTKTEVTLWWDNSADNPSNPDPTVDVTFGRPTTAEMGFGFMKFVDVEPVHIVVGEPLVEGATGGQ
jgi:hypothetical protein